MENIKKNILTETKDIMSFWKRMKDDKHGGFYCSMDYNLKIDYQASKSGIAAARNLWTFSKAYNVFKDKEYLEYAEHAYDFLSNKFLDKKFKGAYWIADYMGAVTDKRKHIYLQAFCIYALSEYYRAVNDETVLRQAMELFNIIETIGFDSKTGSYKEEFTEDWKEKDNELLSENGVIAKITTNTHLHILEAYTNLYLAEKSVIVRKALENIVNIFYEKIYSKKTHHQKVFFDGNWNEVINLQSYGHDIEASWLIDDALKALGDYDNKYDDMVINIADKILGVAIMDDGSVVNECVNGVVDYTKVWWVQAEAAVGFYNAYQKTGDKRYLDAFKNVWNYILKYVVDKRENGEWLYSLEKDNSHTVRDIVELWKTPYHNGRCCFELYERIIE